MPKNRQTQSSGRSSNYRRSSQAGGSRRKCASAPRRTRRTRRGRRAIQSGG
jgi:hypothetical protein